MVLPPSGPITFRQMADEYGVPPGSEVSLRYFYQGGDVVPNNSGSNAAVPSSGSIGLGCFKGTANLNQVVPMDISIPTTSAATILSTSRAAFELDTRTQIAAKLNIPLANVVINAVTIPAQSPNSLSVSFNVITPATGIYNTSTAAALTALNSSTSPAAVFGSTFASTYMSTPAASLAVAARLPPKLLSGGIKVFSASAIAAAATAPTVSVADLFSSTGGALTYSVTKAKYNNATIATGTATLTVVGAYRGSTYPVYVTATDANGTVSAEAAVNVTELPPPTITSVTITALTGLTNSPVSLPQALSAYFSDPAYGSVLTYALASDGNPQTNAFVSGGALTVAPAYRGISYTVKVQATNQYGGTAVANVSVTESAATATIVATDVGSLALGSLASYKYGSVAFTLGSGPYNLASHGVISLPGSAGSYISIPGNLGEVFNWSAQDFTIEAWVKYSSRQALPSTGNIPALVGNMEPTANSTCYWSFGLDSGGRVAFYYYNNSQVTVASTQVASLNAWHHIAATMAGNAINLFLDGVLVQTATKAGTPQFSTSTPMTIGSYFGTTVTASIADLRIVKGYAVYTAGALNAQAFTPSTTTPLTTASSGTTMLLCHVTTAMTPTISALLGATTIANNTATLSLGSYFAAASGDTGGLTYTISSNPKSNATISGSTLTVAGASRNATYSVTVVATSASGGTASQTLTVTEQPLQPVIAAIPNLTVYTGNGIYGVTTATNTANATQVGTLTWSLASGAPAGVSINAGTGVISVAQNSVFGTSTVQVIATTSVDTIKGSTTFMLTATQWASPAFNDIATQNGLTTTSSFVITPTVTSVATQTGTLTWTLQPAGLSSYVNASTGVITIPQNTSVATTIATLTATGPAPSSLSFSKTFSLTVVSYTTPIIAAIADTTVYPGTTGSVVIATATNTAGSGTGTITWSLTGATPPTGISIDAGTGVISAAAGTQSFINNTIMVTATTPSLAVSSTTTFKLTSVLYSTPVITAISNTTIYPGPTNVTVATASSATNNIGTLTWSISASPSLPAGISINSGTGVIIAAGGSTNTFAATTITVTATNTMNATITSSTNFQLTSVLYSTPIITAIPDTTVYTGPSVVTILTASSATTNIGTLTWSLTTFPAGISIDSSTGVISAAAATSSFPSQAVTVKATNTQNTSIFGTKTFQLTGVLYSTPVITAISNTTVYTGSGAATVATAVNTASNVGTLTWSLGVGAPAGTSINATTGVISVAKDTVFGVSTVAVNAITIESTSILSTITFQLTAAKWAPPVIATIADKSGLTATSSFVIAAPTVTPDSTQTGTLVWTLAPAGVSSYIDAATGVITIPIGVALATTPVTVTATGPTSLVASKTFSLTTTLDTSGFTNFGTAGWSSSYINGNVTFNSSSSPYSTSPKGCISLPGTAGSYISIPASTGAVFNWSSQDFTLEAWVNYAAAQSTSSQPALIGNLDPSGSPDYWSFGLNSSMQLAFYYYYVTSGMNVTSTTSTASLNTWTHIAATLSGTTLRLFLNGALVATHTLVGTPGINTSYNLVLGSYSGITPNAKIADVRMIKGFAAYTAAFTPPTTPLYIAASGTTVMMLQGMSLPVTISPSYIVGNVTYVSGGPYAAALNKSVISLPGTAGSYISIPASTGVIYNWASQDFTLEAWVNYAAAQSIYAYPALIGNVYPGNDININQWSFGLNPSMQLAFYYNSGGVVTSSVPATLNTWTHIAATLSGTTLRLFLNGGLAATHTLVGTPTVFTSYNLVIGSSVGVTPNAKVTDVRMVRGSALYTAAFSVPTAPLNLASTGTTLMLLQPSFSPPVLSGIPSPLFTAKTAQSGTTVSLASYQTAAGTGTLTWAVSGSIPNPVQLPSVSVQGAATTYTVTTDGNVPSSAVQAMATSNTPTGSGAGWVFSASSVNGASYAYYAFNANANDYWHSVYPTYSTTDGSYVGTTTATAVSGDVTATGEWLQVQMPTAVPGLTSYTIAPRQDSGCYAQRSPRNFKLLGSIDGTTWYLVDNRVGVTDWTTAAKTFSIKTIPAYTYYRLCVSAVGNLGTYDANPCLNIASLYFTQGTSAGTWTFSASSENTNGLASPYRAFDGTLTTHWDTNDTAGSGNTYTALTGVYSGNVSVAVVGSSTAATGEWLQVAMPTAVSGIASYTITPRQDASLYLNRSPVTWKLLASVDATNWYSIDERTNDVSWTSVAARTFTLASATTTPYSYYRLVVSKCGPTPDAACSLNICDFALNQAAVTINASTGVLTVASGTLLSALPLTVTATNPLSVSTSASVTVDAVYGEVPFPPTYSASAASSSYISEYPPAALTAASTTISGVSYGAGAYVVSASSYWATVDPFKAFNKTTALGTDVWSTATAQYANNTGLWLNSTAATYTTNVSGASVPTYGEWIQLQLPAPIIVTAVKMSAITDNWWRSPASVALFGNNDGGSTWYAVGNIVTGIVYSASSLENIAVVNGTIPYTYYRLVILKTQSIAGTDGYVTIGELRLYGGTLESSTFMAPTTTMAAKLYGGTMLSEYPPAPMTAASTTITNMPYGAGTYSVSVSSIYTGMSAYNVFNKTTGNAWNTATSASYDSNSGLANTNFSTPVNGGSSTIYGEYIQINLPAAITLSSVKLTAISTQLSRAPYNMQILGSVDSGTTWYTVGSMFNGIVFSTTTFDTVLNVYDTSLYKSYRFVITGVNPVLIVNGPYVSLCQIRLYGSQSTCTDAAALSTYGGGNYTATASSSPTYTVFPAINATPLEYPPVALSAALTTTLTTGANYGMGTYVVSVSSYFVTAGNNSYLMFNKNTTETSAWATATASYSTTGTAAYTAGTYSTPVSGTSAIAGEWVQIVVPVPITLTSIQLTALTGYTGRAPGSVAVLGSSDNGNTWNAVGSTITGLVFSNTALQNTVAVSGTTAYSCYRFVFTALQPGNLQDGYGQIVELRLFGLQGWTPTVATVLEYPPAAMTALSTNLSTGVTYGSGTYLASASSFWNAAGNNPFQVFNKNTTEQSSLGASIWATSSGVYNTTTGAYTPTTYKTTAGGVDVYGEWVQLTLPAAITLTSIQITSLIGYSKRAPGTLAIFGTNDDGTTWSAVGSTITGLVFSDAANTNNVGVPGTTSYNCYRFVIVALQPTNPGDGFAGIGELRLFGMAGVTSYAGGASYSGSTSTVDFNSSGYSGEWLQLQSPSPIVPVSYTITPHDTATAPKDWYMLVSNDGVNWILADTRVGYTGFTAMTPSVFTIPASALGVGVRYLRLVVCRNNGGAVLRVASLSFSGHPQTYVPAYSSAMTAPSPTYVLGAYNMAPWNLASFRDTSAKWIWNTSGAAATTFADTAPFYIYTTIHNTSASTTAVNIYACCDDSASVYLNGLLLSSSVTNSPMSTISATLPANSTSVVAFYVKNIGGPAALLACVQRASDSVTLARSGPGWFTAAWTPRTPASVGLSNWFEADAGATLSVSSGTVSGWADLSGSGNTASQVTAAKQPYFATAGLNGRPMIAFNGISGALMSCTGPGNSTTSCTIAAVLNMTGTPTYNQWFSTSGAWAAGALHCNSSIAGPQRTLQSTLNYNASVAWSTFAYADNVPFIAVITISISAGVATITPYYNGVAQTSSTATTPSISLGTFEIGGYGLDVTRTMNSGISALTVFNTALSTADRQRLEGYLAWKWFGGSPSSPSSSSSSTSLPLAVTHPFYKAPPPYAVPAINAIAAQSSSTASAAFVITPSLSNAATAGTIRWTLAPVSIRGYCNSSTGVITVPQYTVIPTTTATLTATNPMGLASSVSFSLTTDNFIAYTSGVNTITFPTAVTCDMLMVGGGGGGSYDHGGGGGAGAVVFIKNAPVPAGTYTITIGGGGAGGTSSGSAGAKGYNTTFVNSGSTISLSAEGGGGADALSGNKNGGSGAGADAYNPQTGDSGGTATAYTPTINSVTVGVKLGGDGGGNFKSATSPFAGAGGGGGGAGGAKPSTPTQIHNPINGADGACQAVYNSTTWVFNDVFNLSARAYGQLSGGQYYFGGGGGNGNWCTVTSTTGGKGGLGGGGNGGHQTASVNSGYSAGYPGTANTGGGGGGGSDGGQNGAAGGSGILLLSFKMV